jgi:hypothetical protein
METGADTVSETQLDLKAGHIFGSVKKMSAASKYEVKIPNGVAGIRGTVYDLTVEGVLKVTAGSVVLAYVGADSTVVTQVVLGGQEFDARSGQITPLPPSEMQTLLHIEGEAHAGQAMFGDTHPTDRDHVVYRVLSEDHERRHASPDEDQNDNDRDERGERDGGNRGGGN